MCMCRGGEGTGACTNIIYLYRGFIPTRGSSVGKPTSFYFGEKKIDPQRPSSANTTFMRGFYSLKAAVRDGILDKEEAARAMAWRDEELRKARLGIKDEPIWLVLMKSCCWCLILTPDERVARDMRRMEQDMPGFVGRGVVWGGSVCADVLPTTTKCAVDHAGNNPILLISDLMDDW